MIDDIFANNESRCRNLRTRYSADTVACMVNDRLKHKNIDETVTGQDVDGFLKLSRLGKKTALVPIEEYKNAMTLDGILV
jgi:hypothetical protein